MKYECTKYKHLEKMGLNSKSDLVTSHLHFTKTWQILYFPRYFSCSIYATSIIRRDVLDTSAEIRTPNHVLPNN